MRPFKMSKALWWIIGGIIVIAVVVMVMKKSDDTPSVTVSPSPTMDASATATPSTAVTAGVSTGTGAKTYSALVTQYGTNRIQFDQYCQAIPKTAVFKTGAKVMFDNRSGDARSIMINGTTYNFPGYGYRVITLSSTTLPKTILLDCGSAQNVGTITIQK